MLALLMMFGGSAVCSRAPATNLSWPELRRESRPWAYWWWMGSAVDQTNLTRELQRYHDAGLGGVHIIPIYGAKGYEDRFIDYLSPKWMDMLSYTVKEAERLNMGVDMTTGTGWCFGGPQVTDQEANASVVLKTFAVQAGGKLPEKLDPKATQALMAFSPEGQCVELTDKIAADGSVAWSPGSGTWQVYAVSQRPSGQKVKRASPGGQGHMLNLIYPGAMRHYLRWFDEAFAHYSGPGPRAMYHDSYEYKSDWAPDFFASFEKRRGYRLQTELPALFSNSSRNTQHATRDTDPDHIARVKSDYRETISDVMAEESLPLWSEWARRHGFLTRNEAHGSPGNWLDLYAAADIPETEMFYKDRSKLVSKFASSAAHVTGRNLAAAETGTWLKEHFTETLADMKYLLDDMFLSGINHVFYHGTCYSPDEAAWPGWHFYASYEMNPRNSVWRDVPALDAYAARCQAVLQSGHADNDILLYWPLHDFWHNPAGMARQLTVHARDWFEDQPIGKAAEQFWNRGYAFDYVSDRQLAKAKVVGGGIELGGAVYRAVAVPRTVHMPLETLRKLLALADSGAVVIFQTSLPDDVPGWGKLDQRHAELKELLASVKLIPGPRDDLKEAKLGRGRVLAGELESALGAVGVGRETMFDRPGLMCVRRAAEDGRCYFIANRSEQLVLHEWVPLLWRARSVVVMDPLSGQTGVGAVRQISESRSEVFLSLQPGESVVLRCLSEEKLAGPAWAWWDASGRPIELAGSWQVNFLQGGPELPASFETEHLASWTERGDANAQRFAGTVLYTLSFDAPKENAEHWRLDLGKVGQSAQVRLNGQDLGTLITPPFRAVSGSLKAKGNVLEVEVTNVSANRIRDLDRRGVKWKNFYDINFVSLDYKPFDASNWPLADSGLLGPVTLTPVASAASAGGAQ
jgi:alpha-L-rhamnosidase